MIEYKERYEKFIEENGVGKNDIVADSVKSYISYLNSVSKYLAINICPATLENNTDIEYLSSKLKGKVSDKTIKNYGSAMKQYVNMVGELNLSSS